MMKSTFFTKCLVLGITLLVANLKMSAQNAEDLFKDYWKVGVGVGVNFHGIENQPSPVNFKIREAYKINYGFTWNFYQKRNNNFSLGLYTFLYHTKTTYDIPFNSSDNIYGTRVEDSGQLFGGLDNLQVPLMYEHFFYQKNSKNYWVLGAGLEFRLLQRIEGQSGSAFGGEFVDNEYVNGTNVTFSEYNGQRFDVGLKFKLGYLMPTKMGLFEFEANAMVASPISNFIGGPVTVKNDINSKEITSFSSVNSNYVGVGVKFYPKRKKSKE